MAGFRDFQTGEVLTAANVNDFLMQQSVMKFADAAARNTALGTAVGGSNALREGMVAYLDDTNEMLVYDGTAWGAVGLPLGTATPTDGQILTFGTATSTWNPSPQLAGIGSNVVQTVKTDTFSTTSSSFVDITGMSATITLSSASSKLLVIAHLSYARVSNEGSQGAVYLRLTGGGSENYVGDTATQLVAQAHGRSTSIASYYSWSNIYSATPVYLASPATTSPVTVKAQMASTAAGTSYFNVATGGYGSAPSSITLIEVAA